MKIDTATHRIYREPFHYRHRNTFVGAFIVVPMAMVPVLIVVLLLKSDVFEKKATLYTSYRQGGLKTGADVSILGERVGNVQEVFLDPRGKVNIKFSVKYRYLNLVKEDSRAVLKQKNRVVGDWEIDITTGSVSGRPVLDGDTLDGELEFDVAMTLAQITGMVATVDSVMKSISRGEGLLGRLLAEDTLADLAVSFTYRLEDFLDKVDWTLGQANRMIGRLSDMGEHGTATMDTLMSFAHVADTLVAELRQVSTNLDGLVDDLGGVPDDFSDVMTQLKKEVVEADVLLKALQRHWLFRRSVRKVLEEQRQEESKVVPGP